MEILHRGIPPSDVEYVGTCSTCSTRVKFKRSEATERGDQREGQFLEVQCPICPAKIASNFIKYVEPQRWQGRD